MATKIVISSSNRDTYGSDADPLRRMVDVYVSVNDGEINYSDSMDYVPPGEAPKVAKALEDGIRAYVKKFREDK